MLSFLIVLRSSKKVTFFINNVDILNLIYNLLLNGTIKDAKLDVVFALWMVMVLSFPFTHHLR